MLFLRQRSIYNRLIIADFVLLFRVCDLAENIYILRVGAEVVKTRDFQNPRETAEGGSLSQMAEAGEAD